ncbi:DnaJ domain-containing protein [Frankia sp. Cr2]|uniref:DnaJ domain-containing protein n=1 Tax=Frankia sp. Cr2 TaxID=3073932 RepID=UPI002AD2E73D|nr:DnaJ domain-containing protein [Frankia sp. Cr2]
MVRPSLYDVLGVQPSASPAQIVTAYRQAARRTHPDTGGSESAFRLVNTAYQVLSDPERRRAYDRRLRSRSVGGPTGPAAPTRPAAPTGPIWPTVPRQTGPPGRTTGAATPQPAAGETQRRTRRRYLAMMACCLALFVFAGSVVRFLSVPAALAMMVIAAIIPPVAAVIANRSRD